MTKQCDGTEAPSDSSSSGSKFGCDSYRCPQCGGTGKRTNRVHIELDCVNVYEYRCTNCNGEGVVND